MAGLVGFQNVGTGESRPSLLFPTEVTCFIRNMGDIGVRSLVHSSHPVILAVIVPNLVVVEPML